MKNEHQDHLREEYLAVYRRQTDEQLYAGLRAIAAELGRPPTKSEVPAADYIKGRFGPWPRILEQAGIKPVSEHRRLKLEHKTYIRKKKQQKGTTRGDQKQCVL